MSDCVVNARAAQKEAAQKDKSLFVVQMLQSIAKQQAEVKALPVKRLRWNSIGMCAALTLLISIFGLLFVGRQGNIGSFLSVFNNLNVFSYVHNGDHGKHVDQINELNKNHALRVEELNTALKVQELKVVEWIAEVNKAQADANAAKDALIEQKQACSAERKKQDAKIAELEYGMRRLRGETWHVWFDFSKGYYPYILPFFFGAAGVYVAMSIWKFLCVHGQDPLLLRPSHNVHAVRVAADAALARSAADLASAVQAARAVAAQAADQAARPAAAPARARRGGSRSRNGI